MWSLGAWSPRSWRHGSKLTSYSDPSVLPSPVAVPAHKPGDDYGGDGDFPFRLSFLCIWYRNYLSFLSFTHVSTLSIFLVPPAFLLPRLGWFSGSGRLCAGRAPAGEAKFKFNPLGAFRCA